MMVVGMALSPQDYSTWVPDICTTHYSAVPDVPRYVRPRLSIVFPKKKKMVKKVVPDRSPGPVE